MRTPNPAFDQLCELVAAWAMPAEEHFTFRVFERIAADPQALSLWQQATTPLAGQKEQTRRHSVNQRLGRFCKRLTGWHSAEQVPLAKSSDALIRTYTRLKPPSSNE